MKIVGIYCITNKITNKIYIGSTIDINRRWKEHKKELSKNKHHNLYLQNSFNKYGHKNFNFHIL